MAQFYPVSIDQVSANIDADPSRVSHEEAGAVSIDQVSANIDAFLPRSLLLPARRCPSIRLVPTSTPKRKDFRR